MLSFVIYTGKELEQFEIRQQHNLKRMWKDFGHQALLVLTESLLNAVFSLQRSVLEILRGGNEHRGLILSHFQFKMYHTSALSRKNTLPSRIPVRINPQVAQIAPSICNQQQQLQQVSPSP